MESRRRRRLSSRPPRRACRREDQRADGDGVDRISGLPDDLLLLVLSRFHSAHEAARTSVLSHRWSDLWRRLPELYFRNVPPNALVTTLAKVAVPKLSTLVMDVRGGSISSDTIASLLHTASRLDPVNLTFTVWGNQNNLGETIELPGFARATNISLSIALHLTLTLPAHGCEFPVLERLSIAFCRIDTGALISRCPHLHVLRIYRCQSYDTLMIHSNTIEELEVTHFGGCVDIVAPELKYFRWYATMHKDFSMSLSAPMIQDQRWSCTLHEEHLNLGIHRSWCLSLLELMMTEKNGDIVIRLNIRRPVADSVLHSRNLQEMFQFPNFSILELCLDTSGHVYGPVVLKLLRIYNGIRRLKLQTNQNVGMNDEACTPNCPCDQPQNWRTHNVFLFGLEEVEIVNFKGRGHELDFLKVMFRCASLTKVVVKLDSKVSPSSKGCKETYKLFKTNPAVECKFYQKRGKEVIYA